jgi:hypothetical protein
MHIVSAAAAAAAAAASLQNMLQAATSVTRMQWLYIIQMQHGGRGAHRQDDLCVQLFGVRQACLAASQCAAPPDNWCLLVLLFLAIIQPVGQVQVRNLRMH